MSRGPEGKRGRLDADFDVVVSESLVAATIPNWADEVNAHRDAVIRSDLAKRQGPAKTVLTVALGLEQAVFTSGKQRQIRNGDHVRDTSSLLAGREPSSWGIPPGPASSRDD
jgi:hypothetical protein